MEKQSRALKDKGVPEGFRRYTAVFSRADYQLLHDWADTTHQTFTAVLARAIEEFIEIHPREAARAGLRTKRPKRNNENVELALKKYPDIYESEDAPSPYDKFL